MTLHALALSRPPLVLPHAEAVVGALEPPHFEVTRHLLAALRAVGDAPSLPAQERSRVEALYPLSPTRELVLPSGSFRPSEHFLNRVLPRAMNSLAKQVGEASSTLGLDPDLLYWKIERKMRSAGYTVEEAEEEHRRRWERYRRGDDMVPFESHASYHLRHAFAAVLEETARQRGLAADALNHLHKCTRIYDPRLPWRHTSPKPDDLCLPDFEKRNGGKGGAPAPAEWLGLEDVTELEMEQLGSGWVTVLDFAWHSRGRFSERHFTTSRLVSNELAERVRNGDRQPLGHEALLRPDPEPGYPTMTVEEAQELLQRRRVSVNEARALLVPLLSVHFGRWWYFMSSDITGLASPWIERFGLRWTSPDSLDMRRGEEKVVRYTKWADGRVADEYNYAPVGSGTRLSLSARLLKDIMSEHGLWLLVVDDITRKIKVSEHESREADEEQEKRSVRLVGLEV